MYAFGPLPKQQRSGRVVGTHQKIDRIARRALATELKKSSDFPSIREILYFEGSRGPDAIKMKSPGKDEPWHFVDPETMQPDDQLFGLIEDHIENLAAALKKHDSTRAAFEAAWLAHAVTDGLTPAHHEPLESQVKTLRHQGVKKDKFSSRVVMTGNGSGRQFVKNNWKYWGAKGVMTSHTLFEAGVAITAKPLTFKNVEISTHDKKMLETEGFLENYRHRISTVARLGMYSEFLKDGWTHHLAQETKSELLPVIIEAAALSWYEACKRAELV